MGMRYNKEYVKKDRRIQTSGPRDIQRRQALVNAGTPPEVDMALVKTLQGTIDDLRKQLNQKPEGTFTADQVNAEVIKAVKVETADLRKQLEQRDKVIEDLKASANQATLSEELMRKMTDQMKDQFKLLAASSGKLVDEVDPDRPKMETVFIDPIEREDGVESHINVEEDSSMTQKEEMAQQVNKLKGLLGGKLPKRV